MTLPFLWEHRSNKNELCDFIIKSTSLSASLPICPLFLCNVLSHFLLKTNPGATPICLLKSFAPTFSPHRHHKFLSLKCPILITIQTCCNFFLLKKSVLKLMFLLTSNFFSFSMYNSTSPLIVSYKLIPVTYHHFIEATFVKVSVDLILSYPMVQS